MRKLFRISNYNSVRMADAAKEDSDANGSYVDDARFAITQFSFWIANADVKAGVLATATTVIAASVASQKRQIIAMFPLAGLRPWLAAVFLAVGVGGIVVCVVGLFQTLKPRRRTAEFSRYSWVSVSRLNLDLVERQTLPHTDRADAWRTAIVLAAITREKFRFLVFSALSWLIGSSSLLLWYALMP